LGQEPTDTSVLSSFPNPLQSSVAQTPIAQWGPGEIAVALGAMYIMFSVFSTTKRGVGHVSEFHKRRKKRLAEQHEAAAKHYRA
jgi:hypothetical protein